MNSTFVGVTRTFLFIIIVIINANLQSTPPGATSKCAKGLT